MAAGASLGELQHIPNVDVVGRVESERLVLVPQGEWATEELVHTHHLLREQS